MRPSGSRSQRFRSFATPIIISTRNEVAIFKGRTSHPIGLGVEVKLVASSD